MSTRRAFVQMCMCMGSEFGRVSTKLKEIAVISYQLNYMN